MSVRYHTILVALELNESEDRNVIEKALQFKSLNDDTRIFYVHAVETLDAVDREFNFVGSDSVDDVLFSQHKEYLMKEAKNIGLEEAAISVEFGKTSTVILEKAAELGADLIIVGTHNRHGLSLLLGNTADSVIHHAPCDVLAVHLPNV
jgi:universal stress protein A